MLVLLGQTKITNPTVTVPAVVAQLNAVADVELREKLLELLVALIADKETLAMVGKLFIEEELLVDTPYAQWLQEIREAEILKGRQEGLEKGRQEGELTTHQQDIMV